MNGFLERIQQAFPVFSSLFGRPTPFIRQQLVAGADAATPGIVSVSGIKKGDQLVGVIQFIVASNNPMDLTAQFVTNTDPQWRVRDDGEIDNTGGTGTTGNMVLVTWMSWSE